MRILGRPKSQLTEEDNPYWVSFSDLMSGLLIIFILAAVALIIELTQKSAEWDEIIEQVDDAERERTELVQEVRNNLANHGIHVLINDSASVITIPEDQLSFETSSFDIPNSQGVLRKVEIIGQVLYEAITRSDREREKILDTVFVEGHTDCVPYNRREIKGNWGLSTFRAISVWEHWNRPEVEFFRLDGLRNFNNRLLFSVSGYADTRPVPSSTLSIPCDLMRPEDLESNRRIDLRFTVRRPSLDEYEQIRGALR